MKYLLIKIVQIGKYSADERFKMHIAQSHKLPNYTCWGSNHNLKPETINNMISDNKKMGYKSYILVLYSSKERRTVTNFEYKAQLLKAFKKKSKCKIVPNNLKKNKHKLWLKLKNFSDISKNYNYELKNFRTINDTPLQNINLCTMARIKKI
ncbi:MAG: hypothetical protein UZ05_CHB002000022 [Chlorobi bacterium OLB5]|nr:MAG: hypothetical protein UZ05_CHB002000022 [Chlorobi bacterium OLB5]